MVRCSPRVSRPTDHRRIVRGSRARRADRPATRCSGSRHSSCCADICGVQCLRELPRPERHLGDTQFELICSNGVTKVMPPAAGGGQRSPTISGGSSSVSVFGGAVTT